MYIQHVVDNSMTHAQSDSMGALVCLRAFETATRRRRNAMCHRSPRISIAQRLDANDSETVTAVITYL